MTNLLDCGRTGQRVPIAGIIDMHCHLGRFDYAVPKLEAEGAIAVMDRIGVETVVCSHVASCLSADAVRGNDEVLAATRAFPGRLLGCVAVRHSGEGEVRAEVERCLQAGFVGIKVHAEQSFPYTSPAYAPAFEAANERRLPVLVHAWGGAKELGEAVALSERYPEASFLLAHAGSRNEGDYLRLAREHPNILLDTALSFSPRGCVERMVAAAGLEKVVWGSDVYCFSQSQQIGKVLGAKIPDEAKVQILSGNA